MNNFNDHKISITEWGEISYAESCEKQLQVVQARLENTTADQLIFCTHPAVVTLGRGTQPGDVTTWQGPTIESSRGGRATYHGPNQQVIYPILNLQAEDLAIAKNLYAYLDFLERVTCDVLKQFGISAQHSTSSELRGVWVGDRKIASIGIAVRKWVSYHGIAINIDRDASAFQGINPCGFSPSVMISLQEVIENQSGQEMPYFSQDLRRIFNERFISSFLSTWQTLKFQQSLPHQSLS